MVCNLGAFSALFTAAFIFLTGNGLLNTLLSARLATEGFDTTTTGMVLSCYFAGLLIGSFACHRVIQRVGHIRAFAIFAATTTAAALIYSLYLSPWLWGVLRLANGVTTFGLFMVIESWLNECTESGFRGRVFSIYMTLTYLGIGIGQQLLNVADISGRELFIIAGVIFSVCLVPVSATEGVHPSLPETKPYRFMAIFRRAPLGMLGSMAAGLTNSAFYTMMPVVCTDIGMDVTRLSWIMSVTVFAGLAAQWGVGKLSDRFDRTLVLFVTVSAVAGLSAVIVLGRPASFWGLALPMGLFGAMAFTVYPVAVARAHDVFGGRDAVAVSAGLLFAYSIGACASPTLASVIMTMIDSPFGLFAFWLLVNGGFALTTLYLRTREKIAVVPVADQVAFVPMKNTSPVVMALDPRGRINGQ
ncbi:MAG TPA: MFS transporter [Desulfosarcina sp.]|nr:MFS transporter [Desulfosarcina sp.]